MSRLCEHLFLTFAIAEGEIKIYRWKEVHNALILVTICARIGLSGILIRGVRQDIFQDQFV